MKYIALDRNLDFQNWYTKKYVSPIWRKGEEFKTEPATA